MPGVIRDTSIQAWEAIQHLLSARRREAYRLVALNPRRTARELEQIGQNPDIHKRLSELEALRVVWSGEERVCSITGMVAVTWGITGTEPIRLRATGPTRRQLLALKESLRAFLNTRDVSVWNETVRLLEETERR